MVFDIDYRLATPTSPSWQHATADLKCAVGWVKAHAARYGVDPERVGLLGSSAGGHLALLAAFSISEPRLPASCQAGAVRAVAALYPVTDLAALYRTPTRWWNQSFQLPALVVRFVGGTPTTVPDRYRIASPATHVGPRAPATYLAHGTRDQVVPDQPVARPGAAAAPGRRAASPGGPARFQPRLRLVRRRLEHPDHLGHPRRLSRHMARPAPR